MAVAWGSSPGAPRHILKGACALADCLPLPHLPPPVYTSRSLPSFFYSPLVSLCLSLHLMLPRAASGGGALRALSCLESLLQ